jgi:hypothetical protein
MQDEYLCRLSSPVRQFVLEVESGTGIEIEVIPDPKQNEGGTTGQGKLAVEIQSKRAHIFVPTNGYFPDGAVRHEVLHVQRIHGEGVPKLALADHEGYDRNFANALVDLDNAIELLAIVPVELKFHPERREHWEAVMARVCSELRSIPQGERRLAVCLHWTFLQLALPHSPSIEIVRCFAEDYGLLDTAEKFAGELLSTAHTKEELVRLLFLTCPELPKNRAALEYLNSTRGTYQKPIP